MDTKKRKRRKSRRAKRGTHISLKCIFPFNYRSSWELKYALYLDINPDVISYMYEPYAIDYVSNIKTGKVRRYWPDFEIVWKTGIKSLVEIKPAKKVNQIRNVKKAAAAKLFAASKGLDYVLITEVDLKHLGLL